jgi:2-oxo-3-hexenedioate decarboxylase
MSRTPLKKVGTKKIVAKEAVAKKATAKTAAKRPVARHAAPKPAAPKPGAEKAAARTPRSPVAALAALVDDAAREAREIDQLSLTHPLTVDQAYAIQQAAIERRLHRGEVRVGLKMGLTSRAKMIQVGVDEVIWGRLTDAMRLEDNGVLAMERYVHPRIEPEIAFLLKAPLSGDISPAEAMIAVAAVAPAMEVIDSRYRNFKFSLTDVIADNASSSSFVIGAWNDPGVDLANLGMVLEIDGRPRQIGSSAAILGHPARALAAASRLAARAGETLQAGWIIMAGAATEAVALQPGMHIRNVVEHLGAVSLSVAAAA